MAATQGSWIGIAPAATNLAGIVFERPPPNAGVGVIARTPAEWATLVINQIEELLSLRPSWDTYGAEQVQPKNADAALRFLYAVMDTDTTPPSIVPTHDGGLQVEWHRAGLDVELLFRDGREDDLYIHDLSTGGEWEGPPELGFRTFQLARRLGAVPVAAAA